jgi:hypothetical protein
MNGPTNGRGRPTFGGSARGNGVGGGGAGGGLTDGVTLDGNGSVANPFNALPTIALDWRMEVLYMIRQLYPAVGFNMIYGSDCCSLSTELVVETPSGTGDAALESITNGGSVLSSTGATAASACVVQFRGLMPDLSAARFISNSRTQAWAVYAMSQVVAPANLAGELNVIAALQDLTNDNFIGRAGTASAANWALSVGGVAVDTGVAADALLHHFLIANDVTTVKGYLDWAQIGAAAASGGIGTGAGYPRLYNANGGNAVNVSHRTHRFAIATVEPMPA